MFELFICLTTIFFILSLISAYYAVKFGLVILRLEDVIEESIDLLDERHKALSIIAAKPVFFDSIEVRQCISEINKSRDIVLNVSHLLVSIDKNLNEENTIEQHSKKSEEESSQAILYEAKEEE